MSFIPCCFVFIPCCSVFNFCQSELLISPSILKESLAGQNILGCSFFPFITLKIPYHSLLACRFSADKSTDSLLGAPLYAVCYFPPVAFNILSLSLLFVSWITMCLRVFLLGFILPGTLCFLDLVDYFLSHVREIEVTQSCPTLGDPIDCSPPGSSIHGILQARILDWGPRLQSL